MPLCHYLVKIKDSFNVSVNFFIISISTNFFVLKSIKNFFKEIPLTKDRNWSNKTSHVFTIGYFLLLLTYCPSCHGQLGQHRVLFTSGYMSDATKYTHSVGYFLPQDICLTLLNTLTQGLNYTACAESRASSEKPYLLYQGLQ